MKLLLFLLLSGCATCDYEATHRFMKKNDFSEICYTIHAPDDLSGDYCVRKK